MSIKGIVKKILPQSLKDRIKEELGTNSFGSTEYVLHISDKGRLAERTAIVTGGSGAIGSAICFRLAMEGALVGVCARSQVKAQSVIDNIVKNGGMAVPVIFDINDSDSMKKAIEEFVEIYGEINILVNNAGGSARGLKKDFIEQDIKILKNVLSTNLTGTIEVTREVLKNFALNSTGRIINMSSVVGMRGKKGMTDYAAAKAGIIGFTRSLAMELGQYGVTVNAISPGSVCQVVFDRNIVVNEENVNCMGKGGNTDDVANAVNFLVSDEARYITGQNIAIDGGRSLGLWGDN